MKNNKTKIILSAIIFLSFAGFVGIASAAGPSLYVSPASLTKTAGDIFSVSVGVSASESKVCAVEGTLVFTNLSCQGITVAGDVNPQSAPTCSNPYFLIGAPGCTTADKTLFTVSVKAESAGAASIGFTGVDIIGEGVSVGSASVGGNYTINAVISPTTPVPTTPAAPSVKTPKVETPVFSEDAKEDEGKDEGEGLETKDEVSEKPDDEQVADLDRDDENNQGSFLAGIAGLGYSLGGWLIILGIVLLVLCVLIVIRKKKRRD